MATEDRIKQEALVDQYVAESNTESAVKLLYELVVTYAKEKNFEKAEALHEKLYDVDPMALTEIVRAGEVIEEEKSQSLDKQELDTWEDLYEVLSASEVNALYYSMKNKEFQPGEAIMEQGQISNRLYFINRGEVKAVFRREDTEVLLKSLTVGDIIGHDQFFSATVCTVSMIAQSTVKTNYIASDVLKKWKNDEPALEFKLFDFCMKHDRVKQELEKKGMERREYPRVPLDGKMKFQLLDGKGRTIGKAYKGEIADISAGGISFLIKTSNADSIRMLLGRRLRIKFNLVFKNRDPLPVDQHAQVTAVQAQAFDDFSIHVKFDKPMDETIIRQILKTAP